MGFYRAWVEERRQVAQALENGIAGGSYADGAILLCATISSMSSILWKPTRRTDRKRFIEVVARCSCGGPDTTRVSAAFLAARFPNLRTELGISHKSLYLTERNDTAESEAIRICSASGMCDCKRTIRQFSYATSLYEQVRCGFVHEYKPGEQASSSDALRGIAGVAGNTISYVNSLSGTANSPVSRRLIHFPLEWIAEVTLAIADAIDSEYDKRGKYPTKNLGLDIPTLWWSEGG